MCYLHPNSIQSKEKTSEEGHLEVLSGTFSFKQSQQQGELTGTSP